MSTQRLETGRSSTYVDFGGTSLDGAYDFGGPGAGRTILVDSGPVTFTGSGATPGGIVVNGSRTIASAAGAKWDEVLIDADVSLSGVTNVTTATGFNMVALNAPTITDAGTITSITNASTFYIEGPPVGSGLTITNAYAIWVDAGNIRCDGVFLASASSPAYSFDLDQDTGFRNAAANEITFVNGGLETLRVAGTLPSNNANYIFTQSTSAGGARGGLVYTASANTNQTASTEVIDINWNLTATMQHATGAITTQRSFVVQPRTYSFVGASTITTAATVAIVGAPIAGTNATITNRYALWVQAGNVLFAGDLTVSGKLTVVGTIDPTSILLSGGTALYFESNDGSTAAVSGAATGRIRYNNSTASWEVSTQAGGYTALNTYTVAGWASPGALTTTDNALFPRPVLPKAVKIEKLRATVQTAPTGADIHIDIYLGTITTGVLDGAAIGQIVIAAGAFYGDLTIAATDWPVTKFAVPAISQVGSTIAGSTATISVECRALA